MECSRRRSGENRGYYLVAHVDGDKVDSHGAFLRKGGYALAGEDFEDDDSVAFAKFVEIDGLDPNKQSV